MVSLSFSRSSAAHSPREDFLHAGGAVLLFFGFLGFLMPGTLAKLAMTLTQEQSLATAGVGAMLLAVAYNTDAKVQELVTFIVSAFGIIIGAHGLLVSGQFISGDVLMGMGPTSAVGGMLYLIVGVWGMIANAMTQHGK